MTLRTLFTLTALCAAVHVAAEAPKAPPESEGAFAARIAAACIKALPAAPAGWEQTRKPEASTPSGSPASFSVIASWLNPKAVPPEAPKSKTDELLEKQDKLAREMGAALEKGDTETADRLNAELEALEVEIEKAPPPPKPATPPPAADAALTVIFEVNAAVSALPAGAKEAPSVSGFPAFRAPAPGTTNADGVGTTFVFVGPWKPSKDGATTRMSAAIPSGVPATSVQSIAVHIEAAGPRAKQIAEKLDWKALKALLGK